MLEWIFWNGINFVQCFHYDHIRIHNRNKSPMQCYKINEQEKKRAYEERVREIEHGSFAPLVFSISGGMGPIATTVYKRMASLIAEKQNHPYSSTLFWLRCKLSFSLLRSAVMCIRGSRSSYHRPTNMFNEAIDLSCSKSRISNWTLKSHPSFTTYIHVCLSDHYHVSVSAKFVLSQNGPRTKTRCLFCSYGLKRACLISS